MRLLDAQAGPGRGRDPGEGQRISSTERSSIEWEAVPKRSSVHSPHDLLTSLLPIYITLIALTPVPRVGRESAGRRYWRSDDT